MERNAPRDRGTERDMASERRDCRSGWSRILGGILVGLALLGCGGGSEETGTQPTSGSSQDRASSPVSSGSGGGAGTATGVDYPDLPVRNQRLKARLEELSAGREADSPVERPLDAGVQSQASSAILQLRELSPAVRAEAVELLASLGMPAATPLLDAVRRVEALDYERVAILDALGRIGDRRALPVLFALVADDESPIVRASASVALAEIGEVRVLPDLVLRLKYEEDGFVVNAICATLFKLGLATGIDKLLGNLDGRIRLREEAAEVLGKILGDRFEFDPWGAAGKRALAVEKMREWWWLEGPRVLSTLNADLDVDPELERRIIEVVFELSKYQMRNVDDGRYILEGLGGIGVPYLCLGLNDENQYVRAHCVEVFLRMGLPGREGRVTLRSIVGDPLLRPDVVRSLGVLEDRESLPLLFRALEDRAIDVRICAVDALGCLGEASALPHLERLAKAEIDSDELEIAIAFTRALLGDESRLPRVIEILDSKAPVGLWDLAARTDRLIRLWARRDGKLKSGYPYRGTPEEKVGFLRTALSSG